MYSIGEQIIVVLIILGKLIKVISIGLTIQFVIYKITKISLVNEMFKGLNKLEKSLNKVFYN